MKVYDCFVFVRPRFLLTLLLAVILASDSIAGDNSSKLMVSRDDFPKAVFYRYANNFDVRTGEESTYRKWTAEFGRMMGVELDDRVTFRHPDRKPIIQRFKREHPGQVLLYYGLGMAADTGDSIGCLSHKGFSNGHWVYYSRSRIKSDITKDTTEIPVKDVRKFTIFRRGRVEDICIYSIGADGKPDWKNAEQVSLVEIKNKQGTIVVKRGCHGTKARAFTGEIYAAPHATVGIHPVWWFNFSKFCPEDDNGKSASDLWAERFAAQLQPGGEASHFDGLQLDTMAEKVYPIGGRVADINNDGIGDDCVVDGINWYAVGVCEALDKLRKRLPEGKFLVSDAGKRAFFQVSGFELEGFPERSDPEFLKYSYACNYLDMWRRFSPAPKYTHVQHKMFGFTIGKFSNKVIVREEVPFHLSRLVLGTATCYESVLTWYSRAPKDPDGKDGIYDEMRMGQENRIGWLGSPKGDIVYPALKEKDMLRGLFPNINGLRPQKGTKVQKEGKFLIISSDARHSGVSFRIKPVSPDLFIRLRIKGTPLKGISVRFPRSMQVSVTGGGRGKSSMFPEKKEKVDTGLIMKNGKAVSGNFISTRLEMAEQREIFHNSLVIKTDFRRGKPKGGEAVKMYWQRRSRVPKKAILSFYSARLSNSRYSVEAAVIGANGSVGEFKEILAPLMVPFPICWFRHQVNLDEHGLGGKEVLFRFVNDVRKGRAHGVWGDVAMGVPDNGGNLPVGPVKMDIRSFFCDETYAPTFYFRNVPVDGPVNIGFEFEGEEPVTIESMTLHSGSGVMAREFEKGVILVNPSPRPYTFNLGSLFLGQKFRRLRAYKTQDTKTNNGQSVGSTVTLNGLDGLFLVKEK